MSTRRTVLQGLPQTPRVLTCGPVVRVGRQYGQTANGTCLSVLAQVNVSLVRRMRKWWIRTFKWKATFPAVLAMDSLVADTSGSESLTQKFFAFVGDMASHERGIHLREHALVQVKDPDLMST